MNGKKGAKINYKIVKKIIYKKKWTIKKIL